MIKKRAIIYSVIFIILAIVIVLSVRYFSYRATISNSNFLKWCHDVSIENIESAKVYSGYGQEQLAYQLSKEDKTQLIKIFKEITVNDLSLRNKFTDSNMDGVNLYLGCKNEPEYIFKYAAENSAVVSVTATEENSDEIGERKNLFVGNESLISFIASKDPRVHGRT